MVSEQVRPIRAWAKHDEWFVLAHLQSPDWWQFWEIPKTGQGDPSCNGYLESLAVGLQDEYYGPLRSLRVLFSTGHEVKCWWRYDDSKFGCVLSGEGVVSKLKFWPKVADVADVELAIDAAVQWITKQQGGGDR